MNSDYKVYIQIESDQYEDNCYHLGVVLIGPKNPPLYDLYNEWRNHVATLQPPEPEYLPPKVIDGVEYAPVDNLMRKTAWRNLCDKIASKQEYVKWLIETKGFQQIEAAELNLW